MVSVLEKDLDKAKEHATVAKTQLKLLKQNLAKDAKTIDLLQKKLTNSSTAQAKAEGKLSAFQGVLKEQKQADKMCGLCVRITSIV